MGFKVIGMGRSFDGDEMREERMFRRELERARREGYEDAMEEMRGGYGERGGYDDDDNSMYDYGERRGVRGTGPYSRYRRR